MNIPLRFLLTIWLLPTSLGFAQEKEVEVIKNVSFLNEDRTEKLDLYLPANDENSKARPAILIVHGGGWHTGDKAAAREKNIATNLAKAGYVCASVNYVLAKKKELLTDNLKQVWPKNLQDCMKGVQFLRANAEKHQINPEKIGAIGGSAGGHLVAMLGTVSDRDRLDPKDGPHSKFSCRVQAVVPLYGVHDLIAMARHRKIELSKEDELLCREASPVSYLSLDDPPFLILHGTNDPLVPVEQSEILQKEAKKRGVKSDLHIIKGAKHSFHLQPTQEDLRPLVIDFFDKHLKS